MAIVYNPGGQDGDGYQNPYWYDNTTGQIVDGPQGNIEPSGQVAYNVGGASGEGYQDPYYYDPATGKTLDQTTAPAQYQQQQEAEKARVMAMLQDPNVSWFEKAQAVEKQFGIESVAQLYNQGFFNNSPGFDDNALGSYIASRQAEADSGSFNDFMTTAIPLALMAGGLYVGAGTTGLIGAGGAEAGGGLAAMEAGVGTSVADLGGMSAAAGGTTAGVAEGVGAYGGMDAGALAGLDVTAPLAPGGLAGGGGAATAGGIGTTEALGAGAAATQVPNLMSPEQPFPDVPMSYEDANFGSFDPGGDMSPTLGDAGMDWGQFSDPGFDWGSVPSGLQDIIKNSLAPQGMNWLGLGSDILGYAGQREYQQGLLDTMNKAVDRVDPFYGQRPAYQEMYKTANTDPNWLQNDAVLQNLQNAGRRNVEANMNAGGYRNSGNILAELTRTGTETAAKYALPRLEQLGIAAGANINPAAAGTVMSSLGQMAGQAGLGQTQSLQSMLGRIPRPAQNVANNAINSGLSNLFGLA